MWLFWLIYQFTFPSIHPMFQLWRNLQRKILLYWRSFHFWKRCKHRETSRCSAVRRCNKIGYYVFDKYWMNLVRFILYLSIINQRTSFTTADCISFIFWCHSDAQNPGFFQLPSSEHLRFQNLWFSTFSSYDV